MTARAGIPGMVAGALVALVLATAACGDGLPSPPTPTPTPGGGTPATPLVVRVEIGGPDRLAPGESGQFTATGIRSDGTTEDVTLEVAWRANITSFLTVTSTGLATGVGPGLASVDVTFGRVPRGSLTAAKTVVVVPAGTYWLNGVVTEDNAVTILLRGARVEILDGARRGEATTTDGSGRYNFFGVSGRMRLRATLDGYEPREHEVDMSSDRAVGFELPLSKPRPDLSGAWRMTVTASPECAELPDGVRSKTFEVTATQQGRSLHLVFPAIGVALVGPSIATIWPDRVTLTLWDGSIGYYGYGYYEPVVFTVLEDGSIYKASGQVTLVVDAATLRGTLDGTIAVLAGTGNARPRPVTASCRSARHAVEFMR